jgi:hypothetical protein
MGVRPDTGELWDNRWLPVAGRPPYTTLYHAISSVVHSGAEVNHLKLACQGTTIQVSINGTTVASISDNTLQAGQLWIGAGEIRGGTPPGCGHRSALPKPRGYPGLIQIRSRPAPHHWR